MDELPIDGTGDTDWLAEVRGLLQALRGQNADRYHVVVDEPRWG
ncbi:MULTISPECIES: hypothetical protein [unclassified Curtobacterium]|nr:MULTISPECIES: hypothetical protein [unclassified Curtobacterium]WIE56068.1 hypothetical protein DEI88_007725 [Curtobacterium sp. MCBD17_003]